MASFPNNNGARMPLVAKVGPFHCSQLAMDSLQHSTRKGEAHHPQLGFFRERRWMEHCFGCGQWVIRPSVKEKAIPLWMDYVLSNGYIKGADAGASRPHHRLFLS